MAELSYTTRWLIGILLTLILVIVPIIGNWYVYGDDIGDNTGDIKEVKATVALNERDNREQHKIILEKIPDEEALDLKFQLVKQEIDNFRVQQVTSDANIVQAIERLEAKIP